MRFTKLPTSIAYGGTAVIDRDFCSISSNQQGVIALLVQRPEPMTEGSKPVLPSFWYRMKFFSGSNFEFLGRL
jgi:hypothetical protein